MTSGENAKDYLYATLRILTDNTDEEIKAYIDSIEKESQTMSIEELQKIIDELKGVKQ